MTLKEMQEDLARQEEALRDYGQNVIKPAKVALEESAKGIENVQRLHASVHSGHAARVSEYELAHQTANDMQASIHALRSKIQGLAGVIEMQKVATAPLSAGTDEEATA